MSMYIMAVQNAIKHAKPHSIVIMNGEQALAVVPLDMLRHNLAGMGIGTYDIASEAGAPRTDISAAYTLLDDVAGNRHANVTAIRDLLPRLQNALTKDLKR